MNTRSIIAFAALIATAACSQQQMAELDDRSGHYYGRNSWTANGQSMARYSNESRAQQDQAIAYKYQSDTHSYGVDAAADAVEAKDLSTPMPPQQAASASPFGNPSAPLAQAEVTQPPQQLAQAQHAPAASGPSMFRWPADGKVVSRFGPKTDGLSNDGINIAAAIGDPIWAAADGEVAYVGKDLEGYGNLLILRHKDGWMSSYAHANEFLLNKGDIVGQGDLLGYIGETGSVRSPQLHFSLREGKIPVDPESMLDHQMASAAAH